MVLWIIPTLAVALIAIGGGIFVRYNNIKHRPALSQQIDNQSSIIYVIGDLHGDSQCTRYWIDKIGVVDDASSPTQWMDPRASLVFMGDYVDKGPQSRQVIDIVRKLTDTFPTKVTALMGNHEMELLKDRDSSRPNFYYHMPYAVVHPGEYFNYLDRELDNDDNIVLQLLMQASMEVYGNNWYSAVRYAPDVKKGQIGRAHV